MKTVEASTVKETLPASETATTPSSSEFQVPANDGPTVRVTDPDGQRTGAFGAAIKPKASPTSLTTDKLGGIASQRPIASIMPTEGSDPTILPQGDCSALSMAHHTQDNSNNDTMQDSITVAVTSSAIEETGNTDKPSQVSAAVMPDEIRDREALSDVAATDIDDPEDEDGSTTPHDRDTASPGTHSTNNDDDDPPPRARAEARSDPTAPEDRSTNRQGECLSS
ncbi:hypothetical protein EIP86_004883 [Pleurotus ostreatoroseus]|nr:hypothetical protein EIP86_004883 [Pleurotus ostreatoroseus]